MAPKPTRYDSQAILVLADDLMGNARTLQNKREAAGDLESAFSSNAKSRIFERVQITTLPLEYRQATSRLIVLGHGDEDSTIIASATTGGLTWTPLQLHELLKAWMSSTGKEPTRVQRISLHMCFGGGNRGTVPVPGSAGKTNQFKVPPSQSFAQKFASMAGCLTVDVTARTEATNMVSTTSNNVFVTAERQVGGRHKAEGDKFLFTTVAGSTPEKPVDATREAIWT
jgi:hypothetical protein